MTKRQQDMLPNLAMEQEIDLLKKENNELKQYVLALQGEVYGARLAAKYLDKELAGRFDRAVVIYFRKSECERYLRLHFEMICGLEVLYWSPIFILFWI